MHDNELLYRHTFFELFLHNIFAIHCSIPGEIENFNGIQRIYGKQFSIKFFSCIQRKVVELQFVEDRIIDFMLFFSELYCIVQLMHVSF